MKKTTIIREHFSNFAVYKAYYTTKQINCKVDFLHFWDWVFLEVTSQP